MEKSKSIFEKRLLLYIDILGAANIIRQNKQDELEKISELIQSFSSYNGYKKDEIYPNTARECYFYFLEEDPQKNIDNAGFLKDCAYIRFANKLFYFDGKGLKPIILSNENLANFDKVLPLKIKNHPKKLSREELKKITSITEHCHFRGFENLKELGHIISSFSDCLVMSTDFHEENFDFSVKAMSLVFMASFLHNAALKKNILLRGAITLGDLLHRGNVILGKALVDAVDLEEKNSIYPRTVIQPGIVDAINPSLRCIIAKDFDGLFFVNYVKDLRYTDELNSTRLYIEKIFSDETIVKDTKKHQKWAWLHNKLHKS